MRNNRVGLLLIFFLIAETVIGVSAVYPGGDPAGVEVPPAAWK